AAVALFVLSLEAKKGDNLVVEEFADVREGALGSVLLQKIAILLEGELVPSPESFAILLWITKLSEVHVADSDTRQSFCQPPLGQAGLTRDGRESDVDQYVHTLAKQVRHEVVDLSALVADADELR
ncbi:MAG TPA: hypothetical protein VFS23_06685, partial [Vicinamibacterales bacterium]|nr:hypothetical protein [Vicinamibacterales bacterium]